MVLTFWRNWRSGRRRRIWSLICRFAGFLPLCRKSSQSQVGDVFLPRRRSLLGDPGERIIVEQGLGPQNGVITQATQMVVVHG